MSLIHLTVVTPQGMPFDGDIQRVVVRTTGGDVCIMPRHIDYAASLGTGEARIVTPEGEVKRATVSGGMLHVADGTAETEYRQYPTGGGERASAFCVRHASSHHLSKYCSTFFDRTALLCDLRSCIMNQKYMA